MTKFSKLSVTEKPFKAFDSLIVYDFTLICTLIIIPFHVDKTAESLTRNIVWPIVPLNFSQNVLDFQTRIKLKQCTHATKTRTLCTFGRRCEYSICKRCGKQQLCLDQVWSLALLYI